MMTLERPPSVMATDDEEARKREEYNQWHDYVMLHLTVEPLGLEAHGPDQARWGQVATIAQALLLWDWLVEMSGRAGAMPEKEQALVWDIKQGIELARGTRAGKFKDGMPFLRLVAIITDDTARSRDRKEAALAAAHIIKEKVGY